MKGGESGEQRAKSREPARTAQNGVSGSRLLALRSLLSLLVGVGLLTVLIASLPAQERRGSSRAENAAEHKDESSSDQRSAAGSRAPDVFPPSPRGFYRGNLPPGPGQPGVVGFYLNLWCFVPVLALFALWTWCASWVDEDSRALHVRSEFWNSTMLACGVAGFLTVLCLPQFLLGFPATLLISGVPVGLYIKERNDRVPESARVMTPEHIQSVVFRKLAQLGIHVGTQETRDAGLGPPIHFIGKSVTSSRFEADRSRQVENSKGYLAAKELVYDSILRRGTDIHLEPKNDELAVRIRIDGVMYPTEPFDRAVGDAVINIFKVLSNMDITEKRRPQDGSFRAEMEGRDVDFRVATQGTRHGEKMSLRILDQSQSVRRLADLGLRKQLREKILDCVHLPHGLFLCCGPTGAGKSTTLYASLKEIDAYQRNIITVEDPVEYKMDNVNQIEINTKTGQTFANSLRSILRQDPDVLLIGEIRDSETAAIACQAANTGHMVFSTVHANDSVTAIYRLLELDVEPFMVASAATAILAQRLVRRLCAHCKEAYKPNPDFLRKAGLPPEKVDKFYRPPKHAKEVCPTCSGLGYWGRIGVFELVVINERIRELIREKAPISAIRAEARKNGMLYMREEGLRLVVRGVTSIDELLRVVRS